MAINLTIIPKDNEDIERVIKRFKRKVDKFKILDIYKEHLVYEKPAEKRRRQAKLARRRK